MAVLVRRSEVHMNTPVTVGVVVRDPATDCSAALRRAFTRFREVEASCSRFDAASELRRLAAAEPEVPVEVSTELFAAVEFACTVARRSGGAFDPTVGLAQEARGFDRNHRTGEAEPSRLAAGGPADYNDVMLDGRRKTVTLRRPLLLDLGAVAKGLAIDLAARELTGFPGYVVEAGGDVLVRGTNPAGEPWRIGIRHPRRAEALCAVVHLRRGAVCTSGDYERRSPRDGGSHLLDPRTGRPAEAVASCTVVASTAMQADGLSTAACVLGPRRGIPWLQRQGVEGIMITPGLQRYETRGFARYEPCPA